MRLRIFTEPQQGATYEQLLAVAAAAERLGFDAFFRSDHYLRMGGGDPGPGPTDAWTTLAGLARDTRTIRLGTLLTCGTFRLPGPLAVTVAQVDAMSDGRVELGLGAGWFDDEHRAYGIPFPPTGERFERLREQLQIITGIWGAAPDRPFSHEGRHYRVDGNPGLPRPAQSPRPPIILGGHGRVRTPKLVAEFADEFNVPFPPLDTFTELQGAVDGACRAAGRDPGSVRRSVALVVCCGEDEAALARRAAAIGRQPDELRANGRRARRPKSWPRCSASGRRAPRSPTCRCSTWPTSTTWSSWPPRCCRWWPERPWPERRLPARPWPEPVTRSSIGP